MDHSFPTSVFLATPVGPRARSLISVRLVLVCVCTFSSMFSAVPHVYSIRFTGCTGSLYARPHSSLDVALDSSFVFVLVVAVAFSFLLPSLLCVPLFQPCSHPHRFMFAHICRTRYNSTRCTYICPALCSPLICARSTLHAAVAVSPMTPVHRYFRKRIFPTSPLMSPIPE